MAGNHLRLSAIFLFYVNYSAKSNRSVASSEASNKISRNLSVFVSNLVHEIAMIGDNQNGNGRLHHVAFWYGIPQHLDDRADLCADWGIPIEIGPIKHGLSQSLCMYVIEPGGNRIELFGDSGYLIFDNDFEPVEWTFDQLPAALNWFGGDEYKTPPTYLTYGTPPIYSGDPEIDVYNDLRENRLGQENYDVKIKFDNKETVEN